MRPLIKSLASTLILGLNLLLPPIFAQEICVLFSLPLIFAQVCAKIEVNKVGSRGNKWLSVYLKHVPSKYHFNKIVHQFDRPYLMCGDFNAHNEAWSDREDDRGRALEAFMIDNDLNLLNSTVKLGSIYTPVILPY